VTIVGIAGPIAAGKSALAKALADNNVGTRASFGAFVRKVANERGVPEERDELQRLGEELLNELGAIEFTQQALDGIVGENLVIDGVRHVAVSDALAARADRYVLVFVELDDAQRQARLEAREERSVDLAALDGHSTEREVGLLLSRADLVVGGDESDAWRQVVALLEDW
jgi:dephospho-CoA kinase